MHNHLHDIAAILSSTGSLLAAAIPPANLNPVIKSASTDAEKAEVTAPEMYNAPGTQYGSVREALAHMIHELHNPERDSYNETLDFTYAKLPALLDMLRDPIYRHGLMLNQELTIGTNGLPFDMVTTFHHIPTATEISFSLPAYIKEDKRLDDCQRVGASYTYFRRYGLRQALGITDGDDDADQAEAKRDRKTRKTKPATTSQREWLPMPGAEGEAAERKALAMGAKPFTAEQYARAAEQERRFEPLTTEEIHYLNSVINPLNGDLRELNDIYEKLQEALFDRVRSGSVSFYDDEDQRRALYRVWLDACREYEAMKAQPEETTVADVAVIDDLPADELERLKKRRDKIREDVASGKMMVDCEEADELDTLYYGYMNGDVPQPPFPEEQKLPAVDLTSEHGALMHAKTTICREIAEGEGTCDEKAALIKKVLSRTDWKTSLEITEILATLTNPGAPASGIELQEDDLPY